MIMQIVMGPGNLVDDIELLINGDNCWSYG